MMWSIAAINV
jgi:hypothetical protein